MTKTQSAHIATLVVLLLAAGSAPVAAKGGGRGSAHVAHLRMPTKLIAPQAQAKPPASQAKPAAVSAAAAITSILLSLSAVPTALPSTPVIPTPAVPTPALADPMPAFTPLAPPSPPVDPTVLSGGTVVRPDAMPSANANSASPSETAPSIAGGGGKSLQDCMGFWDKATHMSKPEWRAACVRSMAAFPDVKW